MNEDTLILKLKKREPEAYRSLLETYQQSLLALVYKYTNDYVEAQDLTQEIFIKIFKNIAHFNASSKLSTWIYRIAHNTCIDWSRKKTPLPVKQLEINGTEHSTEEAVIYKEEQALIHDTIVNLPEIYKSVIILYHFNHLSYKEISEILELSEKTIETRLYRGRRKIKEQLKNYYSGGEGNAL
ncbi:RNA polymerase sigma factor [Vallitalea okinawensis]|uniref:RNA polymerase sigma factor n=1 Tax=Vallitalea okinawensis TaxID=2078660 RepID=UPI0014792BF3|nr:RNA polymerase sigma factor [Vallitalea okinawensis]